MQQWYSMSYPAMEEAMIEVQTMRRFAGIELISDLIRMRPRSSLSDTHWRSTGLASRSLRPSRSSLMLGE